PARRLSVSWASSGQRLIVECGGLTLLWTVSAILRRQGRRSQDWRTNLECGEDRRFLIFFSGASGAAKTKCQSGNACRTPNSPPSLSSRVSLFVGSEPGALSIDPFPAPSRRTVHATFHRTRLSRAWRCLPEITRGVAYPFPFRLYPELHLGCRLP